MTPWQDRVVDERNALQTQLMLLTEFLSVRQPSVDPVALALLSIQQSIMKSYVETLELRIALFKP